MKKFLAFAFIFAAFTLVACGGEQKKDEKAAQCENCTGDCATCENEECCKDECNNECDNKECCKGECNKECCETECNNECCEGECPEVGCCETECCKGECPEAGCCETECCK